MTTKPKQQDKPFDVERFRLELARKLDRLVAEAIEGWPSCENTLCRRKKRCASRRYECIAKWRESLPPLSPEEAKAHLTDFQIALGVRMRLGGETVTAEQLAEAIREEKAARRAAMPLQESDMPARVVEGTKQERIGRAWNDCVAEQNRAREPGPRITRL